MASLATLPLRRSLLAHRATLAPASFRLASNVVTRPSSAPQSGSLSSVPAEQAPNRVGTWSKTQAERAEAMTGPRFEQTAQQYQPRPLAAIELIAEVPIRLVQSRTARCDGDGGSLGHPRIYINLDKPGPHACNYCGIRFENDTHHH